MSLWIAIMYLFFCNCLKVNLTWKFFNENKSMEESSLLTYRSIFLSNHNGIVKFFISNDMINANTFSICNTSILSTISNNTSVILAQRLLGNFEWATFGLQVLLGIRLRTSSVFKGNNTRLRKPSFKFLSSQGVIICIIISNNVRKFSDWMFVPRVPPAVSFHYDNILSHAIFRGERMLHQMAVSNEFCWVEGKLTYTLHCYITAWEIIFILCRSSIEVFGNPYCQK